jgi:c-di-GMP-related signal transduction protein
MTVSSDLLLEGMPTLLPPQQVVVALAEDSVGDPETLDACRALKESGYRIALDDFTFSDLTADLVPCADYVKIDFGSQSDPAARADTMRRLGKTQAHLIAGAVETGDQFEQALAEGFTGMCSLLDAILGQPLAAVLGLLPLAEETRHALCGDQNSRRLLLDCVIAYERGEWDVCQQLAVRAGVDPANLPGAYQEALAWTRGLDGSAA